MGNEIKSCIAHLERRLKEAEVQKSIAIKNKQWSQVAGYDGIATGVIIAIKIVKEELLNYNS